MGEHQADLHGSSRSHAVNSPASQLVRLLLLSANRARPHGQSFITSRVKNPFPLDYSYECLDRNQTPDPREWRRIREMLIAGEERRSVLSSSSSSSYAFSPVRASPLMI